MIRRHDSQFGPPVTLPNAAPQVIVEYATMVVQPEHRRNWSSHTTARIEPVEDSPREEKRPLSTESRTASERDYIGNTRHTPEVRQYHAADNYPSVGTTGQGHYPVKQALPPQFSAYRPPVNDQKPRAFFPHNSSQVIDNSTRLGGFGRMPAKSTTLREVTMAPMSSPHSNVDPFSAPLKAINSKPEPTVNSTGQAAPSEVSRDKTDAFQVVNDDGPSDDDEEFIEVEDFGEFAPDIPQSRSSGLLDVGRDIDIDIEGQVEGGDDRPSRRVCTRLISISDTPEPS